MRNALPLLLVLTVGSCASKRQDERPAAIGGLRPNILVIYADDHAQRAISAYGGGLNRTPNIDRLAQEGALFTSSFVGNSICAPARATVLTGLHSHANGLLRNGMEFDPSLSTFPVELAAAGYDTALFGKWHLRSQPVGFAEWQVLDGQGPYYNPELIGPDGRTRRIGYTTEIITELALEWLERRPDDGRPFLLMVQHKAPHRRWLPGPKQLDLFEDQAIPEPPTLFDDYSGRGSAAGLQEMTIARHLSREDLKLDPPAGLTEDQLARWNTAYGPRNAEFAAAELEGNALVRWKYQRYLKDYLRCVQAVDDGVGRLLDHLDRNGLAEETLVVYTSDQGFYLGEHGWYDKRWMYEESLRTPLLMRWPERVQAGLVVDALVQNIDLAPTFLHLAGVDRSDDLHGKSLVPFLRGLDAGEWRNSIYYRYYEFPGVHAVRQHYGVRTDRYKLIHFPESGEWELYDLRTDPRELESVHGRPEYDDIQAELEVELQRLRAEYRDRE